MSVLDWLALAVIVAGLVYLRRQLAAAGHAVAAWVRARPPLGLLLWAVPLAAIAFVFVVLVVWKVPIAQLADVRPAEIDRVSSKDYYELLNAHRATIVQVLAGAALLLTLYFTWKRVTATEQQVEVAREEQITERFTRAIEQLGSEKLEVRLGGIYALERIARDSERDHWPIMEVLTAYVRENARLTDTPEGEDSKESDPIATDIQAIVTVIRRRRVEFDPELERLDLRGTDLARVNLWGANLWGANLSGVDLSGADLSQTDLAWADLSGADLSGADLQQTQLWEANLRRTQLWQANLLDAHLSQTDLSGADLSGADLQRANLSGATLRRTNLSKADLSRVDLTGADLCGVDLSDAIGLTRRQLSRAMTDAHTILPDYLKEVGEEGAEEGEEEE